MSTIVLNLQGVGKRYRTYAAPIDRLKHLFGLHHKATEYWALKDVSLKLHRGQCLGVIGDNGAGKSTLLKLLAGTIHPSQGQLDRVGRLTAILELGAGFHPDFTGRDNLIYAGGFIGISEVDMQRLTPEIIDFSELGPAIDRPVKTYSSGMVVRLAFALVTAVPPDVLVIDEALAVGDQHFQKKCVQRIETFRSNGSTILFCSHSLYHVRQLCDTVLWLSHGTVSGYGETDTVLSAYENHVRAQEQHDALPAMALAVAPVSHQPSGPSAQHGKLLDARLLNQRPHPSSANLLDVPGPNLTVIMQASSPDDEPPSFGVMLEQQHGVGITSVAMHADGEQPVLMTNPDGLQAWQTTLTFDDLPLHSGQYVMSIYLFDSRGLVVLDEWKNHLTFQWSSPSLTPGLVKLAHRWHATSGV